MGEELKDQRIPIMMSPSEVKVIDDWMFKARIRSRAEAIRRLCQMSLAFSDKFTDAYNSSTDAFSSSLELLGDAVKKIVDTQDTQVAGNFLTRFQQSIADVENALDKLDHLKEPFLIFTAVSIEDLRILTENKEDLCQVINNIRQEDRTKKASSNET